MRALTIIHTELGSLRDKIEPVAEHYLQSGLVYDLVSICDPRDPVEYRYPIVRQHNPKHTFIPGNDSMKVQFLLAKKLLIEGEAEHVAVVGTEYNVTVGGEDDGCVVEFNSLLSGARDTHYEGFWRAAEVLGWSQEEFERVLSTPIPSSIREELTETYDG